jgi:DedD protein
MEQQLKARLIGACVLVVLAVVLIPELLSGRKPAESSVETARGTRTYTIDLGGAVAAGARLEPAKPAVTRPSLPNATATPAAVTPEATAANTAAAESASPAPVDNEPLPLAGVAKEGKEGTVGSPAAAATASSAATAATAVAKTSEVAPKNGTPAPQPARTAGQWAVQVGAFGSVTSANKLIGELRRDGFTAFEAPLNRSGKTLHRVRVGPEADKASADRLSARLRARGLPATVVAND